jgi:hypothetical protein
MKTRVKKFRLFYISSCACCCDGKEFRRRMLFAASLLLMAITPTSGKKEPLCTSNKIQKKKTNLIG